MIWPSEDPLRLDIPTAPAVEPYTQGELEQ